MQTVIQPVIMRAKLQIRLLYEKIEMNCFKMFHNAKKGD